MKTPREVAHAYAACHECASDDGPIKHWTECDALTAEIEARDAEWRALPARDTPAEGTDNKPTKGP